MALSGRDMRDVFQTVTCRLDRGEKGSPASLTDEEKEFYIKMEREILENEKAGRIVNYDFPNDYD